LDEMNRDLVLCVDDEPTLLGTLPIILGRAGFRVAVAEDGAAALETFLRLRNEVCLVLADIVMPVMNGIDMAETILLLDPQTKILLMSAYSDDAMMRQVRRSGFPLIEKPFSFAKLIEKIRSMVATHDAERNGRQGIFTEATLPTAE
jgi:DNA-binding NtrC family response regulator